jgi:hypothetical protein
MKPSVIPPPVERVAAHFVMAPQVIGFTKRRTNACPHNRLRDWGWRILRVTHVKRVSEFMDHQPSKALGAVHLIKNATFKKVVIGS